MTITIPFWLFAVVLMALLLFNFYIVAFWIPGKLGPGWRDWFAAKVCRLVITACSTWLVLCNTLCPKSKEPKP